MRMWRCTDRVPWGKGALLWNPPWHAPGGLGGGLPGDGESRLHAGAPGVGIQEGRQERPEWVTGCVEVGVPRGQPPDAAQVPHILSSRRPAGGPRRGPDLGMRSRVPAGKVPPRLARTGSRACTHRPQSPRGSRQDRKDWEDLVPTRSPSPLPVWWGGVSPSLHALPTRPLLLPVSPWHVCGWVSSQPCACLCLPSCLSAPLAPRPPPWVPPLPSAHSVYLFLFLCLSLSLPLPPSLSSIPLPIQGSLPWTFQGQSSKEAHSWPPRSPSEATSLEPGAARRQ